MSLSSGLSGGLGGGLNRLGGGALAAAEPAPVAAFNGSPTSGVAPLTSSFDGSASTGTITSWLWERNYNNEEWFEFSTNPSTVDDVAFNNSGSYSIRLTVTGPGGSNTLTRPDYITVSDPPPASPLESYVSAAATQVNGAANWANTSNVLGQPNSTVTTASIAVDGSSYYLRLSFDLSTLPDGAVIVGLQVTLRAQEVSGSGAVMEDILQWSKNTGGGLVGSNRGRTIAAGNYWAASLTDYTVGGPTDLWGTTWTPAELKAAATVLMLRVSEMTAAASVVAGVDSVRLLVYFTV